MEIRSEVFGNKVRKILHTHGRIFSDILCVDFRIVTRGGNVVVCSSVECLDFDYDYTMSGFGSIALKGGDFLKIHGRSIGITYCSVPKCHGFLERIQQIF